MCRQPVSIEFMFTPGCECAAPALRLLRRVLERERCPSRVVVRVIADEDTAMRRRFLGSPTILIDGVDIEGPAVRPLSHWFVCRTYESHGENPGVPDESLIRAALYLHPGKRRPSVGRLSPRRA